MRRPFYANMILSGSYQMSSIAECPLVEPEVRFLATEVLKRCHKTRIMWWNRAINAVLVLAMLAVVGYIIWTRYRGKLTPEEECKRNLERYQHILSKIATFDEEKRRYDQTLITGLPCFANEFEVYRSVYMDGARQN